MEQSKRYAEASAAKENAARDPYWYLHVARATDLSGRDRTLYRAFEMLPGALSIATLAALVLLALLYPTIAAYFTIVFAMYWLFKVGFLSIHLRHNMRRLRHNMSLDWNARLSGLKHEKIVHLVLFPFSSEPYEVVEGSIRAILEAKWDPKRIAVVLSVEARAGEEQVRVARRIQETYGSRFLDFLVTVHPDGLPGELPGKGANLSHAAEAARVGFLDARRIDYRNVLVSAFDIDTVVYPHYFGCLTWYFLTAERPYQSSFQPVPLFNNNIWQAPMLARVIAYSSTFWQMIQQERPEKLATFSSHATPFVALLKVGYWQRNVVSEDSRIFWNLFVRHDGEYRVVPVAYPVSMDANAAPGFRQTVANLYRQHRRWTYGVENVAYILFAFMHNRKIPRALKVRAVLVQIEGFWSLVTHPLILFAVGWMPLIVGGSAFGASVLSYSLPVVAKFFLTAAMFGLVASAAYSILLVPKRPEEFGVLRSVALVAQWLLVPLTLVAFSAIPGFESQLRLMTGRYLGFWITPKTRVQLIPKPALKPHG